MTLLQNFFRDSKLFIKKNFLNYQVFHELNNKVFQNDKIAEKYFKKKIFDSSFYFEFGSGNSTFYANKLKKNFISIETDPGFYNFIKTKINYRGLILYSLFPCGDFSTPLFFNIRKYLNKNYFLNYAKTILLYSSVSNAPDLILIDGRFRVLCALVIHKYMNLPLNCTLLIDDYFGRSYYSILSDFYEIKQHGCLAELIKKKKIVPDYLINQYACDFR